ncbi:DUF2589 domain-containing protein [Caldalkalibacillus salinus]|uniref:DUF2589 domain-containing protein n=1 Tax=Caldalkalibacillus salinus TaxID=2803787 RepID=UPI001920A1B9|nr:DUF2589 domain-containing protein [Caldalkalibacillus salinus]
MSRSTELLEAIPFRHLIGVPLSSVIEAQAEAAKSTIEFIEKVGFTAPDDRVQVDDLQEARTITFSYERLNADGAEESVEITVPVLSIVPVPYIRIDTMDIDFSAKITEIMTEEISSSTFTGSSTSGRLSYSKWFSPIKASFTASLTHNRTNESSSASRLGQEYHMNVKVRAVQDNMPAGLSRVLTILERGIIEKTDDSGTDA